MKLSWRRSIVVVWAAALALALVGCSHNTTNAQDPAKPHYTASVSSRSPSPSPSPSTTAAASVGETARSAVDAAWLHYWQVYDDMSTKDPEAQWPGLAAGISVDPIKSQVLKALNAEKIIDVVPYGAPVHRIYSTQLIGNGGTAHLGDCMDTSHYGSMFRKTGKKRSVGVAMNNTVASLVLGPDGRWRVATIAYLTDKSC